MKKFKKFQSLQNEKQGDKLQSNTFYFWGHAIEKISDFACWFQNRFKRQVLKPSVLKSKIKRVVAFNLM